MYDFRLDFLATYAAEKVDGGLIARELETMLGCHVGMSKDLLGKETEANSGGQGRFLYYVVPINLRLTSTLEAIGIVTVCFHYFC